jgi:hypothetical protein
MRLLAFDRGSCHIHLLASLITTQTWKLWSSTPDNVAAPDAGGGPRLAGGPIALLPLIFGEPDSGRDRCHPAANERPSPRPMPAPSSR